MSKVDPGEHLIEATVSVFNERMNTFYNATYFEIASLPETLVGPESTRRCVFKVWSSKYLPNIIIKLYFKPSNRTYIGEFIPQVSQSHNTPDELTYTVEAEIEFIHLRTLSEMIKDRCPALNSQFVLKHEVEGDIYLQNDENILINTTE